MDDPWTDDALIPSGTITHPYEQGTSSYAAAAMLGEQTCEESRKKTVQDYRGPAGGSPDELI